MKYQQWDASVRGCKTFKDDCVVRSLSVVLGKPYARVFTDLMEIGQLMWAYPNHDKVWIWYAEDQGLIKRKPPRDDNGKLIKLKDWDYKGVAIVRNSGHLTAVEQGYLIDTWDCRYRPVNSYWERI